MKKTLLGLIALIIASTSLTSCHTTTTVTYYEPQWYYNCYPVYDYWGYYLYDECYWEYYNQDGSVSKELDLVAEVADKEALILEKTASVYAEKFSLSADKAMKIAKNVKDFSALSDRTESDIAAFAQKLYGVNPSQVVSAVASAQIGMNADLEAVIEKAAVNFETSKDNMKAIIKELHSKALEDSGISL
ncbi:MAG: hypothetical protein N4A33_02170 [Bacteriovoracaceae bacterium]|nr:hypothetical protein [Bacteriovoracaceae bacterium]